MVNTAARARTGEGGSAGDGPQVTWERSGAEERQPQVKTPKQLALENDLSSCSVTQCGETLTLNAMFCFLFTETEPIQSITTQEAKMYLPASALHLPLSPPKVPIIPLRLRLHSGTQQPSLTPLQTPAENSTLLRHQVGHLQD